MLYIYNMFGQSDNKAAGKKAAGSVGEMEEEEEYLLNTSLNRENNSRLACQIKMNETLSGMKIKIPEDS